MCGRTPRTRPCLRRARSLASRRVATFRGERTPTSRGRGASRVWLSSSIVVRPCVRAAPTRQHTHLSRSARALCSCAPRPTCGRFGIASAAVVYGCDAGGLLWLIFLFFLLLGSIFLPSHEAQHLFKALARPGGVPALRREARAPGTPRHIAAHPPLGAWPTPHRHRRYLVVD